MIKRSDHKCSTPFEKEFIEVLPRQGSVLAYVLAGTSEGLVNPRVLEGARCRCYCWPKVTITRF